MDSELVLEESVTKAKLGRGHVHVVANNPTNNPIVIERGITIGSISSISAVIPLMPSEAKNPECASDEVQVGSLDAEVGGEEVSGGGPRADWKGGKLWLPPVDLFHLPEQVMSLIMIRNLAKFTNLS